MPLPLTLLLCLVLCLVSVANAVALRELISIAEKKQPGRSMGSLWLIALFGSAIMLGLVVCAMPDERLLRPIDGATPAPSEDELPDL